MYFLIIGILIIGLLIIFYNPRQNIYENLNERSLKAYLGSINEDTGYEEGSSNSNGKSCLNNGEDGYLWKYNITEDNKVLNKSICVPTIYTDPTAFIPCSSENPGIPDNIKCSNLKNKTCNDEIARVTNIAPAGDEQQYVYICKDKKCPCMNKYGKDYKGPAGNQYKCTFGGCSGTKYDCCPNSIIAKIDKDGSNCGKSWNCDKNRCLELKNETGDYKTLKDCQDKCKFGGCSGTKYDCCPNSIIAKIDKDGSNCGKSWNCDKNRCLELKNETGKYKTLKDCQDKCPLNGISGVSGGNSNSLSWTGCIQSLGNDVIYKKNFNDICNSKYPSSTYDSLDARGCTIGYTRVGCSLNSPDEV